MIRAFFALPLSEQAETELLSYTHRLQPQLSRQPLRWIAPENFHITLAFLGDIAEADVDRLQGLAEQVALNHTETPLRFSRLSWLPSPHKPKVLVVEPEPEPALEKLQAELVQCCREKGFKVDGKRFRPHITLARTKGKLGVMPLEEIRLEIQTPMDELVLFSSQLTPQGAIYRPLFVIPLFTA